MKIAIIGAGPSGIMIARNLIDRGYDVEILEKSDRLGGQARSFPISDFVVEGGTCFLHFGYKKIRRLVKRHGLTLWSGASHKESEGWTTHPPKRIANLPMVKYFLVRAFLLSVPILYRRFRHLTFGEFCKRFGLKGISGHPAIWAGTDAQGYGPHEAVTVHNIFQWLTVDLYLSGLLSDLHESWGVTQIREGYETLLTRIADGIPVRTGSEVDAVEATESGVSVKLKQESELLYDAAIVTSPFLEVASPISKIVSVPDISFRITQLCLLKSEHPFPVEFSRRLYLVDHLTDSKERLVLMLRFDGFAEGSYHYATFGYLSGKNLTVFTPPIPDRRAFGVCTRMGLSGPESLSRPLQSPPEFRCPEGRKNGRDRASPGNRQHLVRRRIFVALESGKHLSPKQSPRRENGPAL